MPEKEGGEAGPALRCHGGHLYKGDGTGLAVPPTVADLNASSVVKEPTSTTLPFLQ